MQKITTFLWFDDQAEEAARFYTSIFKNSSIDSISLCREAAPGPTGSVLVVQFTLEAQQFMALNGGPTFRFTPAISLMVAATTQEEIDELWSKLSAGGAESECGWLTDKYGLSWQITPPALLEMLSDADPEKSNRVMAAMMQMRKLDIAKLLEA